MACPICKKNDSHSLSIKDYEYDIYHTEKYLICSFCKLIYRERNISKKQEDIEEKILYSKNNYKPVKGGYIYDFLKEINACYEKKVIFKYVFKNKLDTKATILDIACGKGYLLKQLVKNVNLECFGIDINVTNKKDNVQYIQSSYRNLSTIKNINADTVVINNFIEHVEDLKYIFDIIDLLKKDSNIIIITPNSDSKARLFFKNCWSGYHAPRHKMLFNISNIKMAFNKYNYIETEIYKIYDPFTNIISVVNLYKELKNSYSILIFIKLIFSPIFVFYNMFNKDRIVMVIKKK